MIDRAELWVLSRDIVWHNSVWIAYALSSTRELSRYPCSPVLHLNINSILKLWDDQNRTKFWSVLFTCACCTIVRMHSISEAWTYVPLPATLYPYMQATLYPYMLCTSLKQQQQNVKVAPCDLFFLDRTMRFLDRTMKFLDRTMRFLDRLRATCFFRSYNEVFRSQGSDSYTHFGWVSHVICHTTLSAHCPSSARCTLQYPYVLGTSLNKTTRCKIPAPSPPL